MSALKEVKRALILRCGALGCQAIIEKNIAQKSIGNPVNQEEIEPSAAIIAPMTN